MELFFFILIVSLAGFVQGITGFGFALIASPIALTFLDKSLVVPSLILISSFLNLFIVRKIPNSVNKKIFLPLIIASLIGMPFGVLILKIIPLHLLQILVGSLSVLFTIAIYFSTFKLQNIKFLTPLSGFLSGVLQTSTAMSGPPVVLLLTSSNITKDEFRKTLLIYFLSINIISLILFTGVGIFTLDKIFFALQTIPFVLLAGYLGHKLTKIIPQSLFRVIVPASVCVTGLYAIYSGFRVQ